MQIRVGFMHYLLFKSLAPAPKLLLNDALQPSVATTDTSCESVVTSGQHQQQQNAVVPRPQRDANNPAG